MDTHREPRIQELRTLIERGDYVVDPARLADAVLGCLTAVAVAHDEIQSSPAARHVRPRSRTAPRRMCGGSQTSLAAA